MILFLDIQGMRRIFTSRYFTHTLVISNAAGGRAQQQGARASGRGKDTDRQGINSLSDALTAGGVSLRVSTIDPSCSIAHRNIRRKKTYSMLLVSGLPLQTRVAKAAHKPKTSSLTVSLSMSSNLSQSITSSSA